MLSDDHCVVPSSGVHALFQQKLGLLAAASEDYKLAAADFLCGLLEPDQSKRMTAHLQGALGHRFVNDIFPEVPPKLMPTVLEEDKAVPWST
jgi:hypothetical protein